MTHGSIAELWRSINGSQKRKKGSTALKNFGGRAISAAVWSTRPELVQLDIPFIDANTDSQKNCWATNLYLIV